MPKIAGREPAKKKEWMMANHDGGRRKFLRGAALATGAGLAGGLPASGKGPGLAPPQGWDARQFGARGDGKSDDTTAIQKALDRAAAAGGEVLLPPGQYRVDGSLHIPVGVTLLGAAHSPLYIEPIIGTVVLATGGREKEDGPALFEMGDSSNVSGLTVYYPDQKVNDIRPYAWTFHLRGGDNTVENVTLINSFNGIRIGPEPNVRHRIRSVYGCVLRRGLWLDNCTDIGRIDNVHWHNHWWTAKSTGGDPQLVYEYMWKNCEGYIFGRTDWEYVTNTFIFPVYIGYHFINTPNGAMNGQLSGIGADASQRCVVVDQLQPMGLLVTNGQFVAFNGPDPTQILVNDTCAGSVRLECCSFWGPSVQNLVSHSKSFVSVANSYMSSGRAGNTAALVQADGGRIQVRGCSFATGEPSIHLAPGVEHAIISDNNGDFSIKNEIGDRAILSNNEAAG